MRRLLGAVLIAGILSLQFSNYAQAQGVLMKPGDSVGTGRGNDRQEIKTIENNNPTQQGFRSTKDAPIPGSASEAKEAKSPKKSCEAAFEDTKECCTNPLSCLGMSKGAGPWVQVAMIMSKPIASVTASDQKEACENMELLNNSTTGLNAAMMGSCVAAISECTSTCAMITDPVAKRTEEGGELSESGMGRRAAGCASYQVVAAQYAMQAGSDQMGAEMNRRCQAQLESRALTGAFNLPNCSSAEGASHPLCQSCSRPGAQNDPKCAGLFSQSRLGGTGELSGGGAGSGSGAFSSSGAALDGLGIPDGDFQKAAVSDVNGPGANAAGVPNNGGGFNGGNLGGAGGGGSRNDGPAGAGGSGLNTNVIAGVGGATGFSSAPGGSGSGSSGSGGGSRGGGDDGFKFDLKKFMPGQENTQAKGVGKVVNRGVASQIGSMHEDIWKRVSRRVYGMCVDNRVVDCSLKNSPAK